MSVYNFLGGIDPRLTWPGMLVLIAMTAGAVFIRFRPAGFGAAWTMRATRWIGILLGLLAALPLALAIWYLLYPRYLDWIEPTIVSASWIGWHGGHFHSLADSGDIAGTWYGPLLYELTGFMLLVLGPSVAGSKILGVTVFFAVQLVSFKVLKRAGASTGQALILTFIQCLLLAGFANQGSAFGLRTDPLLVLMAELAVLTATAAPGFATAALLGGLMGLAANLKLQGLFFIFPIFCFFLSRAESNFRRAQCFAIAGLAGFVALALPFALPGASLPRYLHLLGLARHQGFSRWVLEKNLVYLAMIWSPMLWLWAMFRLRLPPGLLWFCAAFVPSVAMVILAASLPGGGPYNFLAFLPSLMWLLLRLLQLARQAGGKSGRLEASCLVMLLAFVIGFTPSLAMSWYPMIRQARDAAQVLAARAEIETQMREHPDRTLEVGPGRYHDLRVIPVFKGNPLAIDSEAWTDLKIAGIDEAVIRSLIRTCRIDTWLLAAGDPIFQEYLVPGLYSAQFRAEFRAHYRKQSSGGLLDAWRCVRKN